MTVPFNKSSRLSAMIGVVGASLALMVCGAVPTDVSAVPPATLHGIEAETAEIRSARCKTTQCKAFTSVNEAMDIILKDSATTQGITYPIPANRDQIAARRWRMLLRQPAASRVAICDISAAIAASYRREGGDKFVPEVLIELAVRMDVKSCFPIVLAALHPEGELRDDLGILCHLWTPATTCPAFAN